jgi:hypothetical protein
MPPRQVYLHRPAIGRLPLDRRHLGMSCGEVMDLKPIQNQVLFAMAAAELEDNPELKELLDVYMWYNIYLGWNLTRAPVELNLRRPWTRHHHRTINSFDDADIPMYFRFRTKEQLRRLVDGFRIPAIVKIRGNVFTAEEVLLVSLYRLHRPTTLSDACWKSIFGLTYTKVSRIVTWFAVFIENHWGYLLKDNIAYWETQFDEFAEAIREKLDSMGCYFPPANEGGFNIVGFIDNTVVETCRPGGGPTRPGLNAPRHDNEIQQAFYNGWVGGHGLKWQTVDLPNGMNLHVYGPVSCIHSDIYTLQWSEIDGKMAAAQILRAITFALYGDSAYRLATHQNHIMCRHEDAVNEREVLENECMKTCRITIEWDYGTLNTMWSFLDYRKDLKIRRMPVAKLVFLGFILRNAYVTFNNCQTGGQFNLKAPEFEEWISAGPRDFPM